MRKSTVLCLPPLVFPAGGNPLTRLHSKWAPSLASIITGSGSRTALAYSASVLITIIRSNYSTGVVEQCL